MLLQKVKWVKGRDFIDGSPRYTFEGRDPSYTLSKIQVVIYCEKEEEYEHMPDSKRNFYYGWVFHLPTEAGELLGRFKYLKDAKRETEKVFREYCEIFPNDAKAYYF